MTMTKSDQVRMALLMKWEREGFDKSFIFQALISPIGWSRPRGLRTEHGKVKQHGRTKAR
jgi:hypothetical protein